MSKGLIIAVCFLLPVVLCFVISRKKRFVWIMFVIGMASFFVSQIVLRLPLLSMMNTSFSIRVFFQFHPLFYGLFLAVTAGLFEESARWLGFIAMKKHHDSLQDALAFGLGHGGIEAALLIGYPLLSMQVGLENAVIVCVERSIAISFHVALSIIVWWSVHQGKKRILLVAVLVHALFDALILLPFTPWAMEGSFLVMSVICWILVYQWIIRKAAMYETS